VEMLGNGLIISNGERWEEQELPSLFSLFCCLHVFNVLKEPLTFYFYLNNISSNQLCFIPGFVLVNFGKIQDIFIL